MFKKAVHGQTTIRKKNIKRVEDHLKDFPDSTRDGCASALGLSYRTIVNIENAIVERDNANAK